MKKVIALVFTILLFVNCGGNNDTEIVPPTSNDKVTAVNDSYEVIEGTRTELSNFLANDTYTNGSVKITFEASSIKEGSITLSSDNKFTYTPSPTFIGDDSFKYTICSTITTSSCSTGTINITVLDGGNPLAVDDAYEVNKNEVLTINNFLDNDTIVDSAEVESVNSTSSSGTVVLNNDGTISYTPKADFIGQDTFTYTICDNDNPSTCSTGTITITIKSSGGNTGSFNIPSELSTYYNDIDFTLTGTQLKEVLATKTINKHTTNLSYTPGVWNALKESDLDPTDNSKVLLIYGYNDSDSDEYNDRSRSKSLNGGDLNPNDWNREHVYPKSLGNPNLGTSGPGADAHHLRPSDVKMNSDRGNLKFVDESGNARSVSGGWYPGDEWKGDVARMMMYMYLRYGNQCLPKNVTIGTVNSSDSDMINLLLEWNKEDPVSDFEKNRNTVIANKQGNRNPIIDNPYLATLIWGGAAAENTWN